MGANIRESSRRTLYVALLLSALIFLIGLLVLPYFPNNIPSAPAIAIIQSMIGVNGVLFAFSAIIVSILALNRVRQPDIRLIFIYLFGVTVIFLIAIFFDVIDLANMGTTISKVYVIRDVLLPVYFGLGFIYLSSEVYRQTEPN